MSTSPQRSRTAALVVAGTATLSAGLSAIVVLFYSGLSRYMHVEDLGLPLSEDQIFALTRITPAEKWIFFTAAVLAAAGLAALITAIVRSRPMQARTHE